MLVSADRNARRLDNSRNERFAFKRMLNTKTFVVPFLYFKGLGQLLPPFVLTLRKVVRF